MANYPIPPWLNPSAAQGYGELAGQSSRAALNAQLEREQLSQKATQFSIEAQQRSQQTAAEMAARQQQLEQEHQVEQQKIAIDQAYKQQQVALRASNIDIAQKKLDATAEDAAKKSAATLLFQKAVLSKEEGGDGMNPVQAAIKYMAPHMTGTELGRLSALPADFKPGNTFAIPDASGESLVQVAPNHWVKYATIPKTITNAPPALPVQNSEGDTIGNVIQLPGQKPSFHPQTSTGNDLASLIKKRQQEQQKPDDKKDAKPAERKAEGGYKIGLVYKGGLKYLGGDPHDESSWEKVK